jgi:hypothetical protein
MNEGYKRNLNKHPIVKKRPKRKKKLPAPDPVSLSGKQWLLMSLFSQCLVGPESS